MDKLLLWLSSVQHTFDSWNMRLDTRMNLLPHYIFFELRSTNKKIKLQNNDLNLSHYLSAMLGVSGPIRSKSTRL